MKRLPNWNELKKGDTLYLLVPYFNGIYIEYKYQETSVINVTEYDVISFIRFKYTDNDGKRRRINLAVNKLKYENVCLPICIDTRWARHTDIKYGDLLVTVINDKLYWKSIIDELIDNQINEYRNLIDDYKCMISNLENIKNNK